MAAESRFHPLIQNRLLLLIFLFAVYAIYFPIGQIASGMDSHDVRLPIDFAIPFIPEWIYIYAMIYLIGFVPFAVVKQRRILWAAVKAFLFMMGIAYVVFLAFPVLANHRPHGLKVESFATWGLQLCYYVDTPANCFPSLHVAVSFLAAYACLKVDKLIGVITLGLAILIALSTMLVKQHFFADVVFGYVLAEVSRLIYLKPLTLLPEEIIDMRSGRIGACIVFLVYSFCLLVMFGMYKGGWKPWI